MAFEPGKSGNPSGRPRGSKNKADQELKQWLQMLVDGQRKQFERDLKNVQPVQRLKLLEKLMSFLIPKQQSISTEDTIKLEYENIKLILREFPEEALQRLEGKIQDFLTLKGQNDGND